MEKKKKNKEEVQTENEASAIPRIISAAKSVKQIAKMAKHLRDMKNAASAAKNVKEAAGIASKATKDIGRVKKGQEVVKTLNTKIKDLPSSQQSESKLRQSIKKMDEAQKSRYFKKNPTAKKLFEK
jgi:hypothetical protein